MTSPPPIAAPRTILRLGLFRDRPVFEDARETFSGVVVPAHIAAHSADGLWGFLSGLSNPLFFYDPMTYWFVLPAKYWTRGSETGALPEADLPISADDIRPAFRRLFQEYGLLDAVMQLEEPAFRDEVMATLPSAALEFQRRGIRAKTQRALSKYAAILGRTLQTEQFAPDRLVGPYLAIDSWTGSTFRDQCRMNEAALSLRESSERLWTILALASPAQLRALGGPDRDALRLAEFDGVGIWIGDLDEHSASVAQLRAYRALVESVGKPIWLMYGGYFSVLLSHFGVVEISHGIFYTESKRLLGPVGSGPPAERYYVPGLHRFYEPIRAFAIIDAIPEFGCSCQECPSLDELRSEALATRQDRSRRRPWVERLQRHFLRCRQAEVSAVRSRSLGDLTAELRVQADLVDGLPTSVRAGLRVGSAHLNSWAIALG